MRASLLVIALLLPGCAATTTTSPSPRAAPGARPTESFRAEHRELKVHLGHVDAWIGALAAAPADEQRAIMGRVVAFFAGHIAPHAAWEEAKLYPAVDRRASRGEPFTASMRLEHRVVERWTHELEGLAAAGDAHAFARRADQLLGLVLAHFEAEEEVLLPVLDAHMTPAEVERELGDGHAPAAAPAPGATPETHDHE
jgi:hemerythrin-like domain-containing protein